MLEGKFTVFDSDKPVGEGTFTPAGLYVALDFDCGAPEGIVKRLVLHTEGSDTVLGIPVPESGRLRLRRKLAAKQLPAGGEARLCLYTQWPIPIVEPKDENDLKKEIEVEEKLKTEQENKREVERIGELFEPGGPIEHLEDWPNMHTEPGPDGGLYMVTEKPTASEP